jgi:enoyl-CoA hydratase
MLASPASQRHHPAMLELTTTDGVRVLRMAHGKANALDLEFARALADAFKAEAREQAPLVITGTGRIFSAGVDLPRVVREGDEYVAQFLRALDDCFLRLFELEKPVVAAVNGHAIAGGCIISSACDVALMVDEGATIGVPELAVGVPFPTLPLEIMRHAIGTAGAQGLALSCENLSPQQALQLGLVHKLAKPDQLLPQAISEAKRLAAIPTRTFTLVKRQLRTPTMQAVRALASHNKEVAEQWRTPEVKAAIQRFIDKTLKPRG